ncbi:Hypothetical_protein [Hexamita inflata]|uniref:Hypothetical_protein n=1 Tax=Hexamita inflata TaxID=28002 RepID=A0AA86V3S5_9EUKA|nr:Hypothetical protein HINF_LOCUS43638 [Hexamita inflata]
MQLHLLILNNLTRSSFQPCSYSVYKGVDQISYCQKQSTLNNLQLSKLFLIQTSQISHVFFYVDQVQSSKISMLLEVPHYSSFSLFGWINRINISQSTFNVTIIDETSQAAPVCIKCDIDISYSNLTFISSGQNVSGLIIQPIQIITIRYCFLQLRLDADLASGIVLVVSEEIKTFSIVNFNITSHFLNPSSESGLIVSTVLVETFVVMSQFQYCSKYSQLVGNIYSSLFDTSAYSIYNCDSICNRLFFVYGLCLDSLQFSQIGGKIFTCGENFDFIGDSCVCKEGYVLNQSQCVNIAGHFTELKTAFTNQNEQLARLQNTVTSNYADVQQYILSNTSALDQRILDNISAANNYISSNMSLLQRNININKAELSTQMSDLKIYLENNISELNDQLMLNTTKLQQLFQTEISRANNNLELLNLKFQQFSDKTVLNYSIIENKFVEVNGLIDSLKDVIKSLQIENGQFKTQINTLQNKLDKIQFKSDRSSQYICIAEDNCKSFLSNPLGTE